MNAELWNECIKFHGHFCPGLAMGYRASEIAAEELGIPLEKASDEEIVCIAEWTLYKPYSHVLQEKEISSLGSEENKHFHSLIDILERRLEWSSTVTIK